MNNMFYLSPGTLALIAAFQPLVWKVAITRGANRGMDACVMPSFHMHWAGVHATGSDRE